MKTIATIRNSDFAIVKRQQVDDSFDVASVAHKFGLTQDFRLVEVVEGAKPSLQPGESLSRTETVESDKVSVTYSVVSQSVPEAVQNWQLSEELAARGLPGALNTAINTLSGAQKARARSRFDKKPMILRNDPLISGLGTAIGLTSAQIDDIFKKAALRTT